MSYQLRNIEQCYLPGKMADNMHSHKKSDPTSCPVSALLPPQLLLLFESFLSGFTSLSCKSTFCAVSGFYPQKSRNSAYLVPLYHVSSSPPQLLVLSNSFLSLLTSLNIRSTLCAVSGCLWLSKPFKKTKTVPLLCFFDSSCAVLEIMLPCKLRTRIIKQMTLRMV